MITGTIADTVWFPAASLATAERLHDPFGRDVVSQKVTYGVVVISGPRLTPFTLNCTPAIATLSNAEAETVVIPETVAPADGALMDTIGDVVSTHVKIPDAEGPVPLDGFTA